jgi:type I site-specific restriction endonuclease
MSSQNVAKSNVRPGLKAGRSNEFTLIFPLKPGGAEGLRNKLSNNFPTQNQRFIDRLAYNTENV